MKTVITLLSLVSLFSFNGSAQAIYLPNGVSEYTGSDTVVSLKNGDGTLGQTYNKTLCGLSYEQSSK